MRQWQYAVVAADHHGSNVAVKPLKSRRFEDALPDLECRAQPRLAAAAPTF